MIMDGNMPGFVPEEETLSKRESRFGNTEKIIEAMQTGEVVKVGAIENVCEDIPEHANKVDMYSLNHRNANQVLGVEIQKDQDKFFCVFKPSSGENQATKRQTMVDSFYPRECAAYVISDFFDFDVVPPTIIREINGEVGALQLYLDHDYYQNFSDLIGADRGADGIDPTDISEQSRDWKIIAILDWILANCERHEHNMMVKRTDPSILMAIDHGIVMSPPNYAEMALRGPSLQLTWSAEKPLSVSIPDDLIELMQSAAEKRSELDQKLEGLGIFNKQEIKSFWLRVDAILKYKKFLSKMNYEEVAGKSWLGAEYEGRV